MQINMGQGALLFIRLKFESSRCDPLFVEKRVDETVRPGRDLCLWLEEHLKAMGYGINDSRKAGDELWVLEIADPANSDGNVRQGRGKKSGTAYMIGIRMLPEGHSEQLVTSTLARWCILIEKKRTMAEIMLFRNRLREDDPLGCRIIFGSHCRGVGYGLLRIKPIEGHTDQSNHNNGNTYFTLSFHAIDSFHNSKAADVQS